jgi:5,10-methylene-tetrahydrofolate dehydrogenase/methenyl tetrahydrofolate cyclohydrolase
LDSIKEEYQRLCSKTATLHHLGTVPRLDILKCNREPATAAYIRHKCKAAQQVGFILYGRHD